MAKIVRLLSLFLLLATNHRASAQSGAWQKTSLDSVATIYFPGVATRQDVKGQQIYVFRGATSLYMALVQHTDSREYADDK